MENLIEFIVNNIDVDDYKMNDIRDAINKFFGEKYEKDQLNTLIVSINDELKKAIKEKKKQQTDEKIRNETVKAVKNMDKKLTKLQFYQLISKHTGSTSSLLTATQTKKTFEENENKLIGSISLIDWYNIYENEYNKKHNIKKIERQNRKQVRNEIKEKHKVSTSKEIDYPFRSKRKTNIPTDPHIKTDGLFRPYYSSFPHCWEIDHAENLIEQDDKYLFCININTRFLVIFKGPETKEFVKRCLQELMSKFIVKSIRGDGARCFKSNESWLHSLGINTYFTSKKMTFHNKIVDSVIRTIRNAIGYRKINDVQLGKIVNYYNNTYHEGIKMTPSEMMQDVEKEWEYIREKDEELKKVLRNQRSKGYLSYKPGNVLLVHTDLSKTEDKHEKRRRRFDRLGVFIEYVNGNGSAGTLNSFGGNVRVKIYRPVLLSSTTKKHNYVYEITVPVYYTKKLCDSVEEIPEAYKNIYYIV